MCIFLIILFPIEIYARFDLTFEDMKTTGCLSLDGSFDIQKPTVFEVNEVNIYKFLNTNKIKFIFNFNFIHLLLYS